MAWTATTDDFADAVRECAALPDAGTLTDAEIFRVADREIQTRFVPFMRSLRENFWLTTTTETLTVGTSDYRIPGDAQGGTVRMVSIVDSSDVERNLEQVPIQADAVWSENGTPRWFAIVGNKIRLFPTPDTAETLRILYYRRPSKLVPVADCVTFISNTSGVLHVAYDDNDAISAMGDVDIVQAHPPFSLLVDGRDPSLSIPGNAININSVSNVDADHDAIVTVDPETIAVGDTIIKSSVEYTVTSVQSVNDFVVTPTGISTGVGVFIHATITPGGEASDAEVGDYISSHMETCVVQLPAELYYALVSATAAQILNTEGDSAGFAREMAQCERIMQQARAILAPRADGAPRVILGLNSPMRRGMNFRHRSGWDTA